MKRFLAALICAALCIAFPAGATAEESVIARTSLSGSAWDRIANIEIAAARIDGVTIPAGEVFSFNETVGPRTKSQGFRSAPNGRDVKVTGGGVAQAATTLYLALRQLENITFTDKHTYGSRFALNYVSSGSDAILVDYSAGIDFSFRNNGDDLTIGMWIEEDHLYCSLSTLGVEGVVMPEIWLPENPGGRRALSSASIAIDGDAALRSNIALAAGSINDTVLAAGDLFSFNDAVGPRRESHGYQSALNGRGVKVTGGGVAQVASVIWLAVKNMDDVAVVEKSTYGSRYNQDYVASSNDAILIDYSDDIDFSFRNICDRALTISVYISEDALICEIY